jgi:cytidine deaminase
MTDSFQSQLNAETLLRSAEKVRRLSPDDIGVDVPEESQDSLSESDQWEQLQTAAADAAEHGLGDGPRVGCAILAEDETVWTGTSIQQMEESIHAVRLVVFKAVSKGVTEFDKVAVYSDASNVGVVGLCGSCLQTLSAFVETDINLRLINAAGEIEDRTLSELYPDS